MKVHIISDTHFFGNAYRLKGNHRFDYTSLIEKQWRRNVSSEDVVIHIGDISANWNKAKKLLNSLPGEKILIRGNHDGAKESSYLQVFTKVYSELQIDNMMFTHEPVPINLEKFEFNIFGHLHHRAPDLNTAFMKPYRNFFDRSRHLVYVISEWAWSPVPLDVFFENYNTI